MDMAGSSFTGFRMLKAKLEVDVTQAYTDLHLKAPRNAGIDSPGNSKREILVRLE